MPPCLGHCVFDSLHRASLDDLPSWLGLKYCTYVGVVVEVEVDRTVGNVRVTKVYVVHDCGQIINPKGVRAQIEGNVIQTVSRTLKEEVTFDRSMVTSLDWASYPIDVS